MLDSLLRGFEAELEDAAKGGISTKILNLFSEMKRIQNEQPIDDEQNNQVVRITVTICFSEFHSFEIRF